MADLKAIKCPACGIAQAAVRMCPACGADMATGTKPPPTSWATIQRHPSPAPMATRDRRPAELLYPRYRSDI